jgi:phospholipid transport system substrate-binding protein
MKRLLAVFSVFLFLLPSRSVHAGVPMDTVQANVDKVLEVLRDPKLKAESAKETKKERLRHIYDGMFDQVELSRRALTQNWNKLNPAQRKEFVQLFSRLEKAYIDKILAYADEKVVLKGSPALGNQSRNSNDHRHLFNKFPFSIG